MTHMRKIEQQMQNAIRNRMNWSKSNTSVEVDSEGYTDVRLHGNRIAQINPHGDITLSSCGWDTPTTKSRLNAVLDCFLNSRIFQKDFTWYVDDLSTPFFDGFKIIRWPNPKPRKGFFHAQAKRLEFLWPVGKLSTFYPIRSLTVYYKNMRNLQLTEAEETALVNLFLFVHDIGTPPHLEEDPNFDSLWDKVSEPSPFDYTWAQSQTKQSLKISPKQFTKRSSKQISETLTNPKNC